MKTVNFFSVILVVLLIATGCENKKNEQVTQEEVTNKTEVSDNAQSTNAWQGSYFGVIPCASCPGINTLITLGEDGSYESTLDYLESGDEPETTKGKIVWDKNNHVITLGESHYLVEGNQLFFLDADKKKVEGDLAKNYILTKTELEPSLDSNEGYTLQTFTGDDNKKYNIIFNTNPSVPTAYVQTEGFGKMLSQTEAWAKGAEYAASNTKLTVQGDKATLIIKGEKIELKE